MAYQTGTAASPSALKTIIETFCTTNGFALASGWLSKAQSNVALDTRLPGAVTSITGIGTLATVTMAYDHNQVTGTSLTISGATDPLYNGTFSITVTGAKTFTYTMAGTPVANATGTILILGSLNSLTISGANSSDGSVELCPYKRSIFIAAASWPVTYYLFYGASPDQVSCILQYESVKIQVIMFGDINKTHTSAYVGGNWFFATKPWETPNAPSLLATVTDTTLITSWLWPDSKGTSIPWSDSNSYFLSSQQVTPFHCKVGSRIWGSMGSAETGVYELDLALTDATRVAIFRSPNTWNSQAQLVPIQLMIPTSPYFMYVGYVAHMRLIRVDNYEIGDIVTLGSDRWKVFPWTQKNTLFRNGEAVVGGAGNTTVGSGTLGVALYYDGP